MPEMHSPTNPPEHADVRYEKSDVQIGGIIVFGVVLAVLGLIGHFSLVWQFDYMKQRESQKHPPPPALMTKQRPILPRDMETIPQPRLQKSEALEMDQLRAAEEALLTSYGWVDRKEGIVRIPIDEAMKMLADAKVAAHKGVRVRSLERQK